MQVEQMAKMCKGLILRKIRIHMGKLVLNIVDGNVNQVQTFWSFLVIFGKNVYANIPHSAVSLTAEYRLLKNIPHKTTRDINKDIHHSVVIFGSTEL